MVGSSVPPELRARMPEGPEILDLVGEIYDCAVEPKKWPPTLERIADYVGVKAVGINVKDPAKRKVTFLVKWGGNPEFEKSYDEKYFALNPAMTAGWFVGINEPVTCSGYTGRAEWLNCRMYKEWMEPQGYLDACGVNLTKNAQSHAMLSVIRTADRGWFTAVEDRRLRLVSPHVRRSVTIADLLGASALQQSTLAAVIDLLTVGVVLTDEYGDIRFVNRAARERLDRRDAVLRSGNRLWARDRKAAEALRDAIATAARGSLIDFPHAGIAVPIPSEEAAGERAADLAAWILPLDAGLRFEFAAPIACKVAIFLRDLGDVTPFPGELFVRRYGITPAECRVFALLSQGMALQEAAETLGISPPTARTHLQSLFAKTGTRRQADLIKLATVVVSPASRH